ncbi:MAG: hypothetical protein EP330_16665 [Deltaproteobacteria bacterium]|nr:MAG: hypothetical protein EP330_16665 [Deltaproteobacteria bacterium]
MRYLIPALLLTGCSDWALFGEADGNGPGTDPVLPLDTGEAIVDDEPPAYTSCEAVGLWTDQWWGSQPFTTPDDPTDFASRPFWDEDFDLTDQGWSTVSVPDVGHVPSGTDKVYRTTLWLDAVGPRTFLDIQSDDGVWMWLNGEYLGHWGGEWQEEGCVNDDANCTTFVDVAPVEITDEVQVGANVLAVRLSNPILGAYMGVHARCADE